MSSETKDTDLEIMVNFQPLSQEQEQPQYNAWGKPVTRESTLINFSGNLSNATTQTGSIH